VSYGRFAIVVMNRGRGEHWREKFIEDLARSEVTVQNDKIHLRGEWMGAARFEPLEWADETLSKWIALGTRPFVGEPAGLFVWSHFMVPSDASDLVAALAHAARGAGYRLDTHELREHVVRRTFRLTQLTSPHGFDDGAALLEREPGPYMDDVVAAIKQVLDANRIDAWAGLSREPVENNPLRLYPPMELAGEQVPNERIDDVLYLLTFEMWAFHDKLGDNLDDFWYDLDA
jgi:hypothetical protein